MIGERVIAFEVDGNHSHALKRYGCKEEDCLFNGTNHSNGDQTIVILFSFKINTKSGRWSVSRKGGGGLGADTGKSIYLLVWT